MMRILSMNHVSFQFFFIDTTENQTDAQFQSCYKLINQEEEKKEWLNRSIIILVYKIRKNTKEY